MSPTRLTPEETLGRLTVLKALQDLFDKSGVNEGLVSIEEGIQVLKEAVLWFRTLSQNTKFQSSYRNPEVKVGETDTSVKKYTVTGETYGPDALPRVAIIPSDTYGAVDTKKQFLRKASLDEAYRPVWSRLTTVLYEVFMQLYPAPPISRIEILTGYVGDWLSGKSPTLSPKKLAGRIGYLARQSYKARSKAK
jgi:hypothetical protein